MDSASIGAGRGDAGPGAGSGLVMTRHGAAAVITIDRAARLNAIDTSMRRLLGRALADFSDDLLLYGVVIRAAPARAFCAGGDIMELLTQVQNHPSDAFASIAQECALVWRLECFGKPIVSFIDGAVIGSGVGLTLFGTHRVAGPGYRFQMPETAIGLVPDCGLAHVFARLPQQIGVYLGLTGRAIGRADAWRLGLVTHCIASERFGEIEAGFADADPIDPLLDDRHETPGPAPIDAHAEVIERCFAAGTVEEIVSRLHSERTDPEWCAGVLADLARRAPLSLKVTLRHIRRCRDLDLRQTLIVDHRIACRMLVRRDFASGVRALLIDRTAAPSWRPQRLEDVSETMVEGVLAPMPGNELVLPTIGEM